MLSLESVSLILTVIYLIFFIKLTKRVNVSKFIFKNNKEISKKYDFTLNFMPFIPHKAQLV